jgi:hypothetical protein
MWSQWQQPQQGKFQLFQRPFLQTIQGSTNKGQDSKESIQVIFYAVPTSSIATQQEEADGRRPTPYAATQDEA